MSVILINSIDQSLLELAINSKESLTSLKNRQLEIIEEIDQKLKVQYYHFDQLYLKTREIYPYFEKDLLDLETIKLNTERIIKEIDKALVEKNQASTSTSQINQSILNQPD